MKFVTNAHVGVNVDVAQLRKDFDAIVLAGGSEAARATSKYRGAS